MKCPVPLSSRRHRRAARTLGVVLVALAAYGCEGDDSSSSGSASPAPTSPTPAAPRTVAWDQTASTLQVVNSYSFTAVVDGSPAGRLPASCLETSTAGSFACSAPI